LKALIDVFCQRYQELRPIHEDSISWQVVAAAIRAREAPLERGILIPFIRVLLDGPITPCGRPISYTTIQMWHIPRAGVLAHAISRVENAGSLPS